MLQLELKIEKFSENPRKIRKKTQFFNFRAEFFFPSWKKKATSQAELKILQFGSDSSLLNSLLLPSNCAFAHTQHNKKFNWHQNGTIYWFIYHKRYISQHSNYIFVNKSSYFFIRVVFDLKLDTFIFYGLVLPQQPWRSDGKSQILSWILTWKKGEILLYLDYLRH